MFGELCSASVSKSPLVIEVGAAKAGVDTTTVKVKSAAIKVKAADFFTMISLRVESNYISFTIVESVAVSCSNRVTHSMCGVRNLANVRLAVYFFSKRNFEIENPALARSSWIFRAPPGT